MHNRCISFRFSIFPLFFLFLLNKIREMHKIIMLFKHVRLKDTCECVEFVIRTICAGSKGENSTNASQNTSDLRDFVNHEFRVKARMQRGRKWSGFVCVYPFSKLAARTGREINFYVLSLLSNGRAVFCSMLTLTFAPHKELPVQSFLLRFWDFHQRPHSIERKKERRKKISARSDRFQ